MGMRDSLGTKRGSVRRRFVGSTFYCSTSLSGPISCTVPAGVDSCDIIAVGAGGCCTGNVPGSGGAMAIRRNKVVSPGQVIVGSVGAGPINDTTSGTRAPSTTIDGMVAEGGVNGSVNAPGGNATGGDVNIQGGACGGGLWAPGGACPSPAWTAGKSSYYSDSGGPYIHPNFKGRPNTSTGIPELPGAGGGTDMSATRAAGANGGIFFFWYVTEVL